MTEKAPAIDQDGKMINPHNPEFITKVPWYLGNHGPTLKHHNIQKNDHFLSITESDQLIEKKISAQRSAQASAPKTVYRKGACKNCGAMTHKEKDCLERPRSAKRAAWKTGVDIAPDEVVLNLENHGKVSYDAKRDIWKGYDPSEYQEVIERHDRLQQERHTIKEKEKEIMLKQKQNKDTVKKAARKAAKSNKEVGNNQSDASDSDSGSDSDSDYGSDEESDAGDGEKDEKDFLEQDASQVDFQSMMTPQGGVGGNGMRITARNLRIREDTPKYLRNLSLDSAFYDPKSRSMRANPYPNQNPEELPFAGDNFIRYSGDAVTLAQNQVLCWEMQEQGMSSIDVISNPSQAEFLHKQFVEKKKTMEDSKRKAILAKYTDGQAIPTLDPRLRLGQTEAYIEYNADGRVKSTNADQVIVRTKYEEDVMINNHTAVWGSYYARRTSSWGYACCHSCLKSSYCVGKKGIEIEQSATPLFTGTNANKSSTTATTASTTATNTVGKNAVNPYSSKAIQRSGASELFGEATSTKDSNTNNAGKMNLDVAQLQKLKETLRANNSNNNNDNGSEEESKASESEGNGIKRGYNSMQSVEMSQEDMEVYRLKRVKADDPMANYVDEDDLPPL